MLEDTYVNNILRIYCLYVSDNVLYDRVVQKAPVTMMDHVTSDITEFTVPEEDQAISCIPEYVVLSRNAWLVLES